MPTVIGCLDRAMRAWGGAPTYWLTDNERTVTMDHVAGIAVRHNGAPGGASRNAARCGAPNHTVRVMAETKGRHRTLLAEADDDAILDAIWSEVAHLAPSASSATVRNRLLARNDEAIPCRPVGELRRLAAFAALPSLDRVEFAGDYLANPSVGHALVTGQRAAAQLLARGNLATPSSQRARRPSGTSA